MKTIYKYPFPHMNDFELEMPIGYKIIHLAVQNTIPTLWAIVPSESPPTEMVSFSIRGTGQNFSDGEYIGTLFDGPLVWHLFKNQSI